MLHEVAAGYPDGYFSAMILLDHMVRVRVRVRG